MSIEMKNQKTALEKIDAASNLVHQMMLAHATRNEVLFVKAHREVSRLLFDAQNMVEEAGL